MMDRVRIVGGFMFIQWWIVFIYVDWGGSEILFLRVFSMSFGSDILVHI